MNLSPVLLQVEQLRVSFDGKDVVQGVDFMIRAGEKLALVGESGSGKTITALSLLGLAQGARTSGAAHFATASGAVDLLALSEQQLRGIRGQDIAMVFQEPMTALNSLHRVEKIIAETLWLQGWSKTQARQRVIALLEDVGIPNPESVLQRFPYELSGGQRQRVMIAMALVQEPDILIADEPTSALDADNRDAFIRLMLAEADRCGTTVIFVSHDAQLASYFGSVLQMDQLSAGVQPSVRFAGAVAACQPVVNAEEAR